jgi:hypothetical protein
MGSTRGSPGVSPWSVLLPAAWPSETGLDRVVLEADLDGGVAGARYGVGVEPGAQALVSDLRHVGDPSVPLGTAGRVLGDGAWLIPGPESAEVARRLWSADRAAVSVATSLAADAERVWFCDLGRVTPTSPTAPFLTVASLMLLFCRDQPADLVQVPSRVGLLQQVTDEVGVVVVGSPSYDRGELSEFFGCRRVWVVPSSDDLVDLSRQVWTNRRARRSAVWRAAVELAAGIATPVGFRQEVTEP